MGSGDGSGSLGSNGGVSPSDSLYTKLGNNGVSPYLTNQEGIDNMYSRVELSVPYLGSDAGN